ncbi:glycosyltransferase family 1 protein [soil metagenome]
MKQNLRIAYFADSLLEVNGVAMTSKKFIRYVEKRALPFVCIYAGKKTEVSNRENLTYISLKRSPISIAMDEGLKYDPLFQRHVSLVKKTLEDFKPDVFHITGLNDVSIIVAYLAWKMNIPLVGSWHTNLHEFAARRLRKKFGFLPDKQNWKFTEFIENKILDGAKLYYKMPQILLAPNKELCEMLERGTGRRARLMIRGVDTETFSPEKRTVSDDVFRFGFVGRLQTEKNVRLLAEIEKKLLAAGKENFKFLIVGEGDERGWLEKNMKTAELTGFLDGEKLLQAYSNMDVFIFPSETDTFGNVVQEANAAGVPCIVTDQGGPKFIVRENETGFVAKNADEFAGFAIALLDNPEKLSKMKKASREFALSRSWDAVFDGVYDAYSEAKQLRESKQKKGAEINHLSKGRVI